ncbi:MAG: hypothetical protein ACFB2W_08050 [Leptolyngbyaceae cyanobacterium]
MQRTLLTAIALTTALTLFVPVAQADSFHFGLSDGQPDSTYSPFGRSTEAADSDTLSLEAEPD